MSGRLKTILALSGIFLVGLVAGAVIMFGVGRRIQAVRNAPEQWSPLLMQRLAGELELSEEQREAVRPILTTGTEEIRQLRQRSIAQTIEIMQRMERDITAHLTPEQKVKYERIREERRERLRRLAERGDFTRRFRDGERPQPPPPTDAPPEAPRP